MIRGIGIAALIVLVGGCTTVGNFFAGADNTAPPTELAPIQQSAVSVQTLWTTQAGAGSEEDYLKLSPLVSGGKVFAVGSEGRVGAYEADTGRSLWQVQTEAPISSAPGSGDGLVLVGTQDAEVLALDESSGEIVWRARVSSEVLSPPQASRGIVVARTVDGRLFGLDAQQGSQLWVYGETVPVLTLRGTSAPLLTGNRVICGFANGKLVALTLSQGELIWEARIAEPRGRTELERLVDISGELKADQGVVYAASFQGRIAAVEIETGRALWGRDISSYAGFDLDANNLYVTDDEGRVIALDRRDGNLLWAQDKLQARSVTAPAVYGDYVVAGDFEGYLHWMAGDDGRFVARSQIGDQGFIAPPTAADGTLYVSGRSGVLAAMRAQ